MRPQRSLRLEKRSAKSLDTLSGASGEIFYDVDSGTLRIYTNNAGEKVIMATQSWTLDQISDSSFSGNYGDLNGVPTFLSAFTNNVGYITLDDIPEAEIPISTLTGLADVTIDTPVIGQLLEYDGTSWVNTTVAGFTDTNTTYNLNLVTNVDGVDLNLTNSDLVSDTVTILGGSGIAVTISDTNEITIDNDAQYTLDDITGLTISNPQEGDVLEYTGGLWLNVPGTPGVTLTSFTVTSQPASGSGSLTYDDTSGQFTYTPPDLGVAGVALSDLSVTTSTSTEGGTLTYNNSNGVFTFQPAEVNTLTPNTIQFPAGVSINEFSNDTTLTDSSTSAVPTENAVKTYVDTAISGVGGGGSFDQTLNTTDDVQFNSVTSNTFSSGAAGAPVITSASTITLTAPDGIVLDSPVIESIADVTGTGGVIDLDVSQNNIFGLASLTGVWTPNFTNVPSVTNRSQTYIVIEAATGNSPSSIQIDGVAETIRWENQSVPTGSSGAFNVWSFMITSFGGSQPQVFGKLETY